MKLPHGPDKASANPTRSVWGLSELLHMSWKGLGHMRACPRAGLLSAAEQTLRRWSAGGWLLTSGGIWLFLEGGIWIAHLCVYPGEHLVLWIMGYAKN